MTFDNVSRCPNNDFVYLHKLFLDSRTVNEILCLGLLLVLLIENVNIFHPGDFLLEPLLLSQPTDNHTADRICITANPMLSASWCWEANGAFSQS